MGQALTNNDQVIIFHNLQSINASRNFKRTVRNLKKITTDADDSLAQMQMSNFASQNQVQMQPMLKSGLSDMSDLQSVNHNQERNENAFYSVQVALYFNIQQANSKQISIDK